jgi:hypothetical protein
MDYLLVAVVALSLIVLFSRSRLSRRSRSRSSSGSANHRTAEAGLNTILPFLDSVRDTLDLRERSRRSSRSQ